MKIVTVAEMKEIERQADESGLSYYQMMENAGTQSYQIIKSRYPNVDSLFVFCGKGNNGGDGLVVARLIANEGIKVTVVLVEGTPVTEDANINFERLPETVGIVNLEDLDEEKISRLTGRFVVVDALYGTGFHGQLRENGKKACSIMNMLEAPVVALDIPSGCNADTKEVSEGAVNADITVVFHAFKNVHVSTIENGGECVLVGIGING